MRATGYSPTRSRNRQTMAWALLYLVAIVMFLWWQISSGINHSHSRRSRDSAVISWLRLPFGSTGWVSWTILTWLFSHWCATRVILSPCVGVLGSIKILESAFESGIEKIILPLGSQTLWLLDHHRLSVLLPRRRRKLRKSALGQAWLDVYLYQCFQWRPSWVSHSPYAFPPSCTCAPSLFLVASGWLQLDR